MQILVGWEQHFKLIIFLGVIIQKGEVIAGTCILIMPIFNALDFIGEGCQKWKGLAKELAAEQNFSAIYQVLPHATSWIDL